VDLLKRANKEDSKAKDSEGGEMLEERETPGPTPAPSKEILSAPSSSALGEGFPWIPPHVPAPPLPSSISLPCLSPR